jgi:hypothetical protein
MPSDQILKALEDFCSLGRRAHVLAGTTPLSNDKEACAPNPSALLVLGDDTEQAVSFVSNSGGEVSAIPQRKKVPQPIKLERRAIGLRQRLDKLAGRRIVNVNESVTEVADSKFAVNQSESPWGVEVPV